MAGRLQYSDIVFCIEFPLVQANVDDTATVTAFKRRTALQMYLVFQAHPMLLENNL